MRGLAPLVLLCGLIVFPSAALAAAKEAALLWWERVFPALLPFMLCVGLLERVFSGQRAGGTRRGDYQSPAGQWPVFLIGALAGYPAGAKLVGGLQERGALSPEDGQRVALFANLPSPGFLLSVVAIGLYGDKRVFWPMFLPALAVAGVVFFRVKGGEWRVERRKKRGAFSNHKVFGENPPQLSTLHFPLSTVITDAIFDAVLSLLRIGGCLIVCAVVGALLFAVGLPALLARVLPLTEEVIRILLGGAMEMTWGMSALAGSTLPLRLQLALGCFFVTFGGLSVFMQSLCFMKMQSGARYLLGKLVMGLAAGALAFLLTPLFVPDSVVQTLSQAQIYATNALTAGSILAVSTVSLLFALLLGVVLRPKTVGGEQ